PNVLAPVPAQPPQWVFQQIEAEGRSSRLGSPLRTKQAAEDSATEVIRVKLLALPLSHGVSIANAAARDPAVRDAVDRALGHARVYKVDYDSADGSVAVKMMLDPRIFWEELTAR